MSQNDKTNKSLATQMDCTSRQVSKSRKRGWIWTVESRDDNGKILGYKKVKYTAPTAVKMPK